MRFDQRVVAQTPLDELWNEHGVVSAREVRDLNSCDIVEMLRAGRVGFVVADIGSPLRWIAVEECFDFWKAEVREHLADPATSIYLGNFPGEYCYFASEWETGEGVPVILLTMAH